MGEASAVNRTLYTATAGPVPADGRLPSGRGCRTRLPPLDGRRSAGRGRGAWLDHRRRRRARVPRRGGRRHRRRRRSRPDRRSPRPWPTRPARVAFAHGSAFTTEPLEAYAAEVGVHLPVDDPYLYPVSGGSEAIETALKIARAYHLAVGEPGRDVVIARWGSYHGNTLGALDLSGRLAAPPALRAVARAVRARVRGLPVRRRPPGRDGPRRPRGPRRRAGAGHRGGGGGARRGLRRRARRRGDAGRRGPAGRLLAADRRGLPPPRRAADRRRGHDRLRADRALVRVRPLGPATGPARGGQGGHVGLLAVRVRRRVRRDPCRGHRRAGRLRPRVHVLAQRGRRGRGPRGAADARGRSGWSRRARPRATGCGRCSRARWASTRRSARSAASG